MRTYPLHEARAEFSKLIERALKGEPQRVTRYGKEAVVIVSEADWATRPKSVTLSDLFLKHAGDQGYEDLLDTREPLATTHRPPGSDFLAEDE